MKAVLESEDDVLKGKELWFILWEFDAQLKEIIKYNAEEEKENLCNRGITR